MSKQEHLLNCINQMNAKLVLLKCVNEQQKKIKTEMAELYIALEYEVELYIASENEVENLAEKDETDEIIIVMDNLRRIMEQMNVEIEINQ